MVEYKRIYFVGIKGVGMASLALIAKEAGLTVCGSDVSEEFITDKTLKNAGIAVDIDFKPSDLESFVGGKLDETLVVTTAAHGGLQNPQTVYALEKNIKVLTHGQAVGYFMQGDLFHKKFQGVSVLGCHGKTTITAMAAAGFTKAKLDPTYTTGTSQVFPLGAGGHFGSGDYFIAEADEFISDVEQDRTVKFLYQFPKFAIINNIDFDHPDVYKSLVEVEETFLTFCLENIQKDGVLFINGDDKAISNFHLTISKQREDLKVITYGEGEENDIRIINFKEIGWGSEFEVLQHGESLGVFHLSVPGFHNAKNVLSVIALLLELGVAIDLIQEGVAYFKGTKRRQEQVGVTSAGAIVIDDYAHHPLEIEKTLTAIKQAYPGKKILCLFQPHTLSRTQSLWKEFAQAFKTAQEVLFLPIFTSKREGESDYSELYENIREKMEELGTKVTFLKDTRDVSEMGASPYFYEKNRQPVVKYIDSLHNLNDMVIVTLGAGDLYRIAYDLIRE